MRRLVLIGAGGHARVVLEVFRAMGDVEVLGFVDPTPPAPMILGLPVLGDDSVLESLRRQGVDAAFVALGANGVRQRIGDRLEAMGYTLPAAIHPSALISPTGRVGAGAVVMARAVVGTQATVDRLAILNTGAVIDHDVMVGTAAHVAPGCALAGNVQVGDRALVGVGSSVRPGVVIGADAVIGAGSAVVRDIEAGARVGGAPAKPLPVSSA